MNSKNSDLDEKVNIKLDSRIRLVEKHEEKIWDDFSRKYLRTVFVDRRRPVSKSSNPDNHPEIAQTIQYTPQNTTTTLVQPSNHNDHTDQSPTVSYTASPAQQIAITHNQSFTPLNKSYILPQAKNQSASVNPSTEVNRKAIPDKLLENIVTATNSNFHHNTAFVASSENLEQAKGVVDIALFSAWLSFFAAVAGGIFTYLNPEHGFSQHSWLYLTGYGFMILVIWFLGILPLTGEEVAHKSLNWFAPILWGIVCFGWPSFCAIKISAALVSGDLWLTQIFNLIIPVFITIWAIGSMWHVGTALTMSKPWPQPLENDFKGWGSKWLLLGFLSTAAIDYHTYDPVNSWKHLSNLFHS